MVRCAGPGQDPPGVIQQLNTEINRALETKSVRDRIVTAGGVVVGGSPARMKRNDHPNDRTLPQDFRGNRHQAELTNKSTPIRTFARGGPSVGVIRLEAWFDGSRISMSLRAEVARFLVARLGKCRVADLRRCFLRRVGTLPIKVDDMEWARKMPDVFSSGRRLK